MVVTCEIYQLTDFDKSEKTEAGNMFQEGTRRAIPILVNIGSTGKMQGHRTDSVNYLSGRLNILTFLKRIVTSNFRDMEKFNVCCKCRSGYRKKVSYHFRKGDKT